MNINVVPSVSTNKDYTYFPTNTPYIGLTIAAGLMSLVIPVFVCKYRFKRRSADVFGEAPFDKGELLRTNKGSNWIDNTSWGLYSSIYNW